LNAQGRGEGKSFNKGKKSAASFIKRINVSNREKKDFGRFGEGDLLDTTTAAEKKKGEKVTIASNRTKGLHLANGKVLRLKRREEQEKGGRRLLA